MGAGGGELWGRAAGRCRVRNCICLLLPPRWLVSFSVPHPRPLHCEPPERYLTCGPPSAMSPVYASPTSANRRAMPCGGEKIRRGSVCVWGGGGGGGGGGGAWLGWVGRSGSALRSLPCAARQRWLPGPAALHHGRKPAASVRAPTRTTHPHAPLHPLRCRRGPPRARRCCRCARRWLAAGTRGTCGGGRAGRAGGRRWGGAEGAGRPLCRGMQRAEMLRRRRGTLPMQSSN